MNFNNLIQQRYSVRKYSFDPIGPEVLQRVLGAACLAPTAANKQAFRIVVVHTKGKEELLKPLYNRGWFVEAPIILVVCTVVAEAWVRSYDGKNFGEVDATIVADHLILAATEEGLGTCWIAAFDPAAARKALNIPKGIDPVICITLGHGADTPRERKRKKIQELTVLEAF